MSSVRKQYPFDLIEKKWQRRWDEEQTFRAWNPGEPIPEGHPFAKRHGLAGAVTREALPPKYYILDMFPYPSGAGLHVGHPEGYTATDILARYQRAKGRHVLHPMGWDAFGLPAEQYAIKTGQHPRVTTERNIENFKRQIQSLGFSYDWSREVNTTDPAYFKWTQWIFLKLYNSWFNPETNKAEPIETLKYPDNCATEEQRRAYRDDHRLAYVTEAPVWWCEALGTVLANEEVVDGKSEIGGHPVTRKPMRQWMLRITAYAERLLQGLDQIDWSESLKEMQRNWIGKSEGAEVDFQVVDHEAKIRVFTTRPDTLFGATYMVLSPEHELVDQVKTDEHKQTVRDYQEQASRKSDLERTELSKEKTGVFTGAHAINPVNDEKIPIWIADYVLAGYGTGAIMAVPAHDTRDLEFAKTFDLPIRVVVEAPEGEESEGFVGDGVSVNSDFISGLPTPEAKKKITAWLEEKGLGKKTINYKLRDWLFSRQRYWGEPVPIVWREDAEGNRYHEALPETELPLVPPPLDDYKPTPDGKPPLARAKDWVELPDGARRETNTMPQWAGSCWYYLRFLDPKNDSTFCSREAAAYWMGASLQGWEKQFRELYDFALNNPKNEKRYVTFDRIGAEEAARLEAQIGLKLAGFRRFIDNYAVVHILREHGDPDKESQRGLAAITFEDFLSIPRIVKFPDKVSLAGKTAIGLARILYEKKIDGWICYVEEVRTKHDLLATKTFFKKPAAASHANEGLAQTSETLRRTQNNISETHRDDKAATPGVDLYVGGTEHAVLHLLYARFWHQVLYDLGYAPTPEPFYKLVNQGLILGEPEIYAFRDKTTLPAGNYYAFRPNDSWAQGPWISADDVTDMEEIDQLIKGKQKSTGREVIGLRASEPEKQIEKVGGNFILKGQPNIKVEVRAFKMSKSRGNVVNPDDILRAYGADAFRLYEMFMGPLEMVKPWSTKDVEGVYRFLGRVWRLFIDKESHSEFEQAFASHPDPGADLLGRLKLNSTIQDVEPTPEQLKSLHACIKKVTEDLDGLRFNTAISAMMIFTNDAIGWEVKPRSVMRTFLVLLQPFAPHVAEELYEKISAADAKRPSLAYLPWPEYDASLLSENAIEMPIQVNGKVRDRITVSVDASRDEIEKIALSRERIQAFLDGREIKKIIVVPKKLINIAVK